jgi:hypothetical protein
MAMAKKDYVKWGFIVVLILIPVWMVSPFGTRAMRSWAISDPQAGTARFWMGMTELSYQVTLRQSKLAELLREKFLLWPQDPESGQWLFEAGRTLYNQGVGAERSDQYRYYTQAWMIWGRMEQGAFKEVELGSSTEGTPTVVPLRGLKASDQTVLEGRLEHLQGIFNTWFATPEPSLELQERYRFPDGWDPAKIR